MYFPGHKPRFHFGAWKYVELVTRHKAFSCPCSLQPAIVAINSNSNALESIEVVVIALMNGYYMLPQTWQQLL